MLILSIFSVFFFHQSLSSNPQEGKIEKPLFVPTINYPTLVHLNPLNYGLHSLDTAAYYPQYVYDHGTNQYIDSFQRQIPHQDNEKRLENFLFPGKVKKYQQNTDINEDDYKLKPNNILNIDEFKPELDDIDLKFKRSLTYTAWTPPTLSSTNNLEDRNSPSNSRAVPFGPYTTWLPYEGPLVTSYTSQNVKPIKGSSGLKKNRRRRDLTHMMDDNHLTLSEPPVIPQTYAISVPIVYSMPWVTNRNIDAMPSKTLYVDKLTTGIDTIVPNPSDLAVSYNVVHRK